MMCVRMLVMVLCLALEICHGGWKAEADGFLRKMPEGLQDHQATAVRQGRRGDCSALNLVRKARNGRDPLPAGVISAELPGGHRLYRPAMTGQSGLPLLIYFHGGGWAFGSVNSCGRFCGKVCAQAHALVLAVNYRLAPEHPYPAGLEDCVAVVELARNSMAGWGGSVDRIFLGGDSAGGNLALVTALKLQERCGLQGLVLFYPVVKAWNDRSVSWRMFQKGFGLDGQLMEEFNLAYCGRISPRLSEISPACAGDNMLKRLPPILQVNAERDILRDQGTEFVARLKGLGVSVRHHVLPGTVHLFITVQGQEGAFQKAVSLTSEFLAP